MHALWHVQMSCRQRHSWHGLLLGQSRRLRMLSWNMFVMDVVPILGCRCVLSLSSQNIIADCTACMAYIIVRVLILATEECIL